MKQDQIKYKEFLQHQLQRTKEQILILDERDSKLLEMKKIAKYAFGEGLDLGECSNLNDQIKQLKKELDSLETLRKEFSIKIIKTIPCFYFHPLFLFSLPQLSYSFFHHYLVE